MALTWAQLALAGGSWVATGAAVCAVLQRRGHDRRRWALGCFLAGPLSVLFVIDQARFVEPEMHPVVVAGTVAARDGITVVVPAAAVGAIDRAIVARLGLPVGRVTVAASVDFEHADSTTSHVIVPHWEATLAEALQRFAPHPVDLVVLPGTIRSVVTWAADHAPALVMTTRGAHRPGEVGSLARLAAQQHGVSIVVVDPTSLVASTTEGAQRRELSDTTQTSVGLPTHTPAAPAAGVSDLTPRT